MNMTQARVIIQYVVTAAMAYVVGKGWLPQDVASELGALIVTAIPVGYSVWKSRTAGKISTAASIPGVTVIAPDPLAAKSPKPNVVPASDVEVKPK